MPSLPCAVPHPWGTRDFPSQTCSSDAMQWSIWSMKPDNQYRVLPDPAGGECGGVANPDMVGSTLDTLQIHQVSRCGWVGGVCLALAWRVGGSTVSGCG